MAALSKERAAKILGVSIGYSLEDLKEAYRNKLQQVCTSRVWSLIRIIVQDGSCQSCPNISSTKDDMLLVYYEQSKIWFDAYVSKEPCHFFQL